MLALCLMVWLPMYYALNYAHKINLIHACTRAHMHARTHARTHTHTHAHTHTHTHTQTHTHIHTDIRTRTQHLIYLFPVADPSLLHSYVCLCM